MSVEQCRDGWRVRWRTLAGRARTRQCPSKRTANALDREIKDLKARGVDWAPAAGPAADLPAILSAYLEDCGRIVTAGTVKTRHIVLNLFADWLAARHRGDLSPELLTRDALAAWHGHLLGARKLCRNTANAYVGIVLAAWTWAHDSDAFGDDVPRPRTPALPAADPPRRAAAPTWAEMDAAIDAARARGVEWYARLMTVQRFTGLRPGQARRLDWADVDLGARVLTIRPELGKSVQERGGRTVPIPPPFAAELAGWGVRVGPLVAGQARETAMRTVARFWRDAGVDAAKWSSPLHCLRKGYVSGLAGLGVDERLVQMLVGHARGVTGDVYTDAAALWPALVEAVARVPARGAVAQPAFGRRVRGVSAADNP